MAHTLALSVGHINLGKEVWLRRMAESNIVDFEYSNGPYPPAYEARNNLARLKPYLDAGGIRFPSLHLPFHWESDCPGQPEDFERNLCADRLKYMIELFLPLGMKHLTMHTGAPAEGLTHDEGITYARMAVERVVLSWCCEMSE